MAALAKCHSSGRVVMEGNKIEQKSSFENQELDLKG
jgi:hypothetical protein